MIMIGFLLCVIDKYTVHNANSYKIESLGECTISFDPPEPGEDTYVTFLNPENFRTSTANHLEPVFKNICEITIKSLSENQTLYFSFIKIATGFCETVDFYFTRGDHYFSMWTLPKYAKACFIYPAWEGVDFNFENIDPYANSEFFDSDSSQHTPYFAFNLIQRFRRNSTTESSSYTHQFSKFDVRHPIVVKNFHIWYNEDDQTFKTNSDKSYNFGATLCPNNLPGVPHKAQKRIKIIKRHNQTIKY